MVIATVEPLCNERCAPLAGRSKLNRVCFAKHGEPEDMTTSPSTPQHRSSGPIIALAIRPRRSQRLLCAVASVAASLCLSSLALAAGEGSAASKSTSTRGNRMHKTIESAKVAVPPVPALTSGLSTPDEVYITGQLAFDPAHKGIRPGLDAAGQTEVILDRIEALLGSEGLTLADLVKVTIFVTDREDIFPMNDVYARRVKAPVPARSTIGVAFLALPGAKVEIEAVARRRVAAAK
jgi:2-iminobutanoate/2-iminopropanoate deaminase